MKQYAVVNRYAEAFISYARKEIGLKQAISDIHTVNALIRDNAEFKEFLESSDITAYEKSGLIERALKDAVSPIVVNFLKLLLDKKRIEFFPDIAEYLSFTYSHEGAQPVLLRTGSVLDIDLIKRLEAELTQKYGKKLKFYIEVDNSLIAGVQVFIGNTILDGSARKRLLELKDKLKSVEVN